MRMSAWVWSLLSCAGMSAFAATDTVKPTVAVAAPTAKQRIVTNGTFVARGTARDNVGISVVRCRLNGADWMTASGTTNWTATLSLAPSATQLWVCATDRAGNSTTSTVLFTYVPMGNLSIQTVGSGSVTRTPTGAPEIGKTYTLTARASAGFAFQGWSDGHSIYDRSPTLSFVMPDGISLIAVFRDVVPPTLTMTTPARGTMPRVTNAVFTVRGTAADNVGVSSVFTKLNGGFWRNASGTTAWSASLALQPGSNSFIVAATDEAGNCSAYAVGSCTYVQYANLTIVTNGSGAVQRLPLGLPEVACDYTFTASPASGWAFTGWRDGEGRLFSDDRAVTLTMPTNLALRADFRSLDDIAAEGVEAFHAFMDEKGPGALDTTLLTQAARQFGLAYATAPTNVSYRVHYAFALLAALADNSPLRDELAQWGLDLSNLIDPQYIPPVGGPPAINHSIDALTNAVAPVLDRVITVLGGIPTAWSGSVEIPPSELPMLDNSVWVDLGDVASVKAACRVLRGWLDLLSAYSLNLSYDALAMPVPCMEASITVDADVSDWAGAEPTFLGTDLGATQACYVANDTGRVAMLLTGCDALASAVDWTVTATLRPHQDDLFGDGTNRVYVSLYGAADTVDGMLICSNDGFWSVVDPGDFEAALSKQGVMEFKLPAIDGVDAATPVACELLKVSLRQALPDLKAKPNFMPPESVRATLRNPRDVPLIALLADHPEFCSRVRNPSSLARCQSGWQAAATDYLSMETLVTGRSDESASRMHLINVDPSMADAMENVHDAVLQVQTALKSGGTLSAPIDPDIDPTGKQSIVPSKFFASPYLTTNRLPANLAGTLKNPSWTAFPDPTFNGILPGMTNPKLDKLLRWDSLPPVAPASLGGRVVQVQGKGSEMTISFDANGKYTQGERDDFGGHGEAGTYVYVRSATNSAQALLTLTRTVPPAEPKDAFPVQLVFAAHDKGACYTGDNPLGSFKVLRSDSISPASLSGQTMAIWSDDGQGVITFGAGSFSQTGMNQDDVTGTYTYSKCGPVSGLLAMTIKGYTEYEVLVFDSTIEGQAYGDDSVTHFTQMPK